MPKSAGPSPLAGVLTTLSPARAVRLLDMAITTPVEPENILFQEEGVPLIGDFGSAVQPVGEDREGQ